MVASDAPADGADTRNQPEPVRKENENEDGGKEPERLPNQVVTDDAFQESVELFHEPFPEILGSFRNCFDVARSDLSENDEEQRDHPCEDHGTGDETLVTQVSRVEWETVLFV